jgi:hypothetical protein
MRATQRVTAMGSAELERSGTADRMTLVGATPSLPRVPAIVSFLNPEPPLSLGSGNRSSCPIADIPEGLSIDPIGLETAVRCGRAGIAFGFFPCVNYLTHLTHFLKHLSGAWRLSRPREMSSQDSSNQKGGENG